MTPLGVVLGVLALPACVPVVIMVAMLGMARLEARLLPPSPGRHDVPQEAPPSAAEAPDDRNELVPAAHVDWGELHGQRV